MTHPDTLPSSVTETPETDSDRVSEERLRECPMCGQREFLRVIESPPLEQESEPWGFHVICSARGLYTVGHKPTHPVGCGTAGGWGETVSDAIAAWNRRTTPSLPPRSGGVVEFVRQVLEWASDGIDPDGNDIQRLGVETGLLLKVTYDPDKHDLPEWLKGDVEPGDDYFEYSPAIRSTLANPIPEAPAAEEVEGLAQALRNLAEGAEQEDRTILYKAAVALRRSTETDKPGVREAALEEAAKVADMFAADHAKSADQFGIDRNRELHNAAKGAAQGVAFAIRALSASPAPEEQVTDVEADRRERASKVKPDKHGHRTRFSDSSYFDEVCIMCGATDGFGDKRLDQPCPSPLHHGRRDQ